MVVTSTDQVDILLPVFGLQHELLVSPVRPSIDDTLYVFTIVMDALYIHTHSDTLVESFAFMGCRYLCARVCASASTWLL